MEVAGYESEADQEAFAVPLAPAPMMVMPLRRKPRAQRRGLGLLLAATILIGYGASHTVFTHGGHTMRLMTDREVWSSSTDGDSSLATTVAWDPNCYQAALEACPSGAAAPALGGVDVVEYFASRSEVHGSPAHSVTVGSSVYYFSSQANADLFAEDPTAYAPQLGGFCAFSLSGADVESHATTVCDLALETVDTSFFQISDGKLYVFKGEGALERMEGDRGFEVYAANAVTNYNRLNVDADFVNSNSDDCQATVSDNWRTLATEDDGGQRPPRGVLSRPTATSS